MISLTKLNGDQVAINPDRIERADVTPDVVLTMTDGSKFVIAETLDELIDRIRLFRASILGLSYRLVFDGDDDDIAGHLHIVRGAHDPETDQYDLNLAGAHPSVSLHAIDGVDASFEDRQLLAATTEREPTRAEGAAAEAESPGAPPSAAVPGK